MTTKINPNEGTIRPRSILLYHVVGVVVGLLAAGGTARADWKDDLIAEQNRNSARLVAIDAEAKPVDNQLHQVMAQIVRHNAHQCVAPANNPGACAWYDAEARQLNASKQRLVHRLQPLADESNRLIERNREIARKLRCVPLPKACQSDADCNECSTCGSWDGDTKQGLCQPLKR